jgi:3,4-dihydroxy-2-butanone 4-phosphate synthase
LMKLAGIDPPVAVDMEILAQDGSMGTVEYIYHEIAKPNDIKVISVGQICKKIGIEEKTY